MTAVIKEKSDSSSDSIYKRDAKARVPVLFTESAKEKLSSLLLGKNYLGIRIKVLRGGCLGSKYAIEYVKAQDKFDEVISLKYHNNLIRIFVDPKVMLKIFGVTVDYVVGKFGSGFEFVNPREKGRCGCGKSFH